jgi:antitoxin Phd
MKTWTPQDAKARFSELLETCLRDGPQLITRYGEKAAVLVPAAQWQRLTSPSKPTLKDLLLADAGRFDIGMLPRSFEDDDQAGVNLSR